MQGKPRQQRQRLPRMVGGAFDFIVPPMTSDELAHVLACAVESVSNLRRRQGMALAVL